jgi:hypothetical protein
VRIVRWNFGKEVLAYRAGLPVLIDSVLFRCIHYDCPEGGDNMATKDEARAAATVKPSNRTDAQRKLVSDNSGDQSVRNADTAAQREERIHGK